LGFSPCVVFLSFFVNRQRLKPETEMATFGTTEVVP